MKKFTAALLSAVLLALSLSSCGDVASKNPTRPDDIPGQEAAAEWGYDLANGEYRVVSENDNLKFEFNNHTTDIKITDKSNGYVWSTETVADDGSVSRGNVFSIDYYNTSGSSTLSTFDSATDSIEKGQYRIEDIQNGVKVTYGVGDIQFKILCPLQLKLSRADIFLNKMNEDQRATFDYYYQMISFDAETLEKYPSAQVYTTDMGYSDEELEALKKSYADAVDEPCYYPSNRIDYYAVAELNPLFAEIGYTQEDADIDNAKSKAIMNQAEFQVVIYYTLEGGEFKVRIPESEMYNPEMFIIDTLRIHPSLTDFGAKQQGYFFLPDGSGSVMNFTNGKDVTRADPVYINMYGVDASRGITEKTADYNEPVFPVYGTVVNNGEQNNALFTIIESGDAFAGLTARSSDGERTRNQLVSEFRISEKSKLESLDTSGGSDEGYTIYQFQRYLGDIELSYNFLSGANANYSGMAKVYEKHLFGENASGAKKDYYSTVDIVGSVLGVENILGVSYKTDIALTTYEQAQTIVKDLQANGMSNLGVKLSGWTNEGLTHSYLEDAKVSSLLGGEDSFKSLIKAIEDSGAKVYPDGNVQFTLKDEPKNDDWAEALDRYDACVYSYDEMTFEQFGPKAILNMNALKRNLNGYLGLLDNYNIKTVSLGEIGKQVNANYARTEDYMERQETLDNLEAILKEKTDAGYSIMGVNGIGKLGKYMSVINDVPVKSAQYDKCDYSVPFASMVYSGHKDITGDIINLSNNDRKDLLNMIECGVGAQFQFTGEYYADLYATTAWSMYSTVYNDIKDYILEDYNYLKTALKDVYGQKIVAHERVVDGVFKTTYANNKSVYVNYNLTDYNANGVTVKAESYAVADTSVVSPTTSTGGAE